MLRLPRLPLFCLLAALLGTGCLGARETEEQPPDERFGHRYTDDGPEGRDTIVIAPPDSVQRYFVYPAVYDSVYVRPAPFGAPALGEAPETQVEVLVKGAFPDACAVLHDVEQARFGNLIDVTLAMRKPEGAVCAAVRRPYRFYLLLDGVYEPGHYTLTLNGIVHPFEVRLPTDAG